MKLSCRQLFATGAVLALLAVLAGTTAARADLLSSLGCARIEEDWTLVINEPNDLVASPQVSTQMSARAVQGRFYNFHVNSRDVPNFQLGGLQLQVWLNTSNLAAANSSNAAVMSTTNEMVTW